MQKRAPIYIALVLCLLGIALSGSLLGVHIAGENPGGLLGAACGEAGSGCDKVINSRWGVFPPRKEAPPAEAGSAATASLESDGIPVALLGLFYFSVIFVWLAAVGRPTWDRRKFYQALIALCLLGALLSIAFIVLMGVSIKAWCPLCLGTHVANFALVATIFIGRPRLPIVAGQTGANLPAAPIHPGARLAVITLFLAASVCAAEWGYYKSGRLESVAGKYAEEILVFQSDAERLDSLYFNQEKEPLLTTQQGFPAEDDPIIPAVPGRRNTLVLFSDMECDHCRFFDGLLFDKIMPLYKGHLRVVFKHYPLEDQHPTAFKAATALEAARLRGKFWEMHDYMMDRPISALKTMKFAEAATAIGVTDPMQFIKDMHSPAVKNRILADRRLGVRVKITGTPSVFVNSRHIVKAVRNNMVFWRSRVKNLQEIREKANQPW